MHVPPLQHVYCDGHAGPICNFLCPYAAHDPQKKA